MSWNELKMGRIIKLEESITNNPSRELNILSKEPLQRTAKMHGFNEKCSEMK